MRPALSENLTRIRKLKGISQERLAKLAGVTRRTIAYYESDAEKSHIENVYSIAKALNVSVEELLASPTENNSQPKNIPQIDSRTMKKMELILSLPKEKRHMIYTMAEALAAKEGKMPH